MAQLRVGQKTEDPETEPVAVPHEEELGMGMEVEILRAASRPS